MLRHLVNQLQLHARNNELTLLRNLRSGSMPTVTTPRTPSRPSAEDSLSPDALCENLRASVSEGNLTHLIRANISSMTNSQIITALEKMVEINHKEWQTSPDNSNLLLLTNRLLKHARFLDFTEVISALKYLIHLNVSSKTIIMQTLLQYIRREINDLTLKEVLILEILLKKMVETPLTKTLQLALPVVVENHLAVSIQAEDSPEQLSSLFSYASKHRFSLVHLKKVVDVLLSQRKWWTTKSALEVLWGVSYLSVPLEIFERLFMNAVELVTQNIADIPRNQLLHLLSQLANRNCSNHFLFAATRKKAINETWDLESLHKLIALQLKVRYVDAKLLDIYSELLEQDWLDCSFKTPVTDALDLLAYANVVPQNMSRLLKHLRSQNELVSVPKSQCTSRVKLALNLLLLGESPTNVCQLVWQNNRISSSEFQDSTGFQLTADIVALKTLLGPECWDPRSDIKLIQPEAAKTQNYPLQRMIDLVMTDAYLMRTCVFTKSGIHIDHLVMRKCQTASRKDLISSKESESTRTVQYVDDLDTGSQKLAVLVIDDENSASNSHHTIGRKALSKLVLEKEGFAVAEIHLNMWQKMYEKEQVLYMKRLIADSLNNL